MSRTQRDIASYFPHDAHASLGDTLTILQSRYGNDGYAVWFKLLEKLTHSEGHYYDCRSNVKWQLLIAQLGVNEITTVEILNLLVEMGNIDKDLWDSKLIWCQNLVNNLADVYKNRRREIPQKPIISCSNGITTDGNPITTDGNPQSRVEYSRVNKSKEYAHLEDAFDKFWSVYPKKVSKANAKRAYFKINPDEQLQATILNVVERAKKSRDWLDEGGRFIPYPASWLNQERWKDEGFQSPNTMKGGYDGEDFD